MNIKQKIYCIGSIICCIGGGLVFIQADSKQTKNISFTTQSVAPNPRFTSRNTNSSSATIRTKTDGEFVDPIRSQLENAGWIQPTNNVVVEKTSHIDQSTQQQIAQKKQADQQKDQQEGQKRQMLTQQIQQIQQLQVAGAKNTSSSRQVEENNSQQETVKQNNQATTKQIAPTSATIETKNNLRDSLSDDEKAYFDRKMSQIRGRSN